MNQEEFDRLYQKRTSLLLVSMGLFLESSREDVLGNSEWEEITVVVRRLSSFFQENNLHEIVHLMKSFAELEPREFAALVQRLGFPFQDTGI